MKNNESQSYIGLAKVLFNSSVCHISQDKDQREVELILSERLTRKKGCGEWPYKALENILGNIDQDNMHVAENRDVISPRFFEEKLNLASPFFEFLKKRKVEQFSSHFNDNVKFVTHHLAHAYSCVGMSPFEESLIVVMDGAGSLSQDFEKNILIGNEEKFINNQENYHEEFSAFIQKGSQLECVEKVWQKFEKGQVVTNHSFSEGLGMLYEKGAEYIFSSKRAAGKVMGLAPFGQSSKIKDPIHFLESLQWDKSFQGQGKDDWEKSQSLNLFQDVASSIQEYFEEIYLSRILKLKEKYPHIKNLIIAGGCALNCVSNMKIIDQKLFENVYIPPFPGDEGIGFGLAHYMFYKNGGLWNPIKNENQHGYFGPQSSLPRDEKVEEVFSDYKIERFDDVTIPVSNMLKENKVLAWFQGRSESGPRALGNRSIIARVDYPNLKQYLNERIKFRENFRPYGCSVSFDKAHLYFDIEENFSNPYMSFAAPLRTEYKDLFKEVAHVDGTSRKQSVTPGQNKKFYDLIEKVGEKTGTFAVLNTSLNIMGEPIVETVEDVKRFFETSNVDALCVGDYVISR